jgi:hypothetical protein
VVLEGFEMPPDRERYALSQQMIVLKIRRLRARERGLPKEALREETGDIAAEQRSVRANFVFLMGGEVEDEEEEAEHSHEIQEGRLENTARQEISRAISHMTYAEQALVGVDTARALQQARLAVDALQKAFGRNRYILRTLPVRSRVDPSRRLSGELDEAGDWRRTPSAGPADEEALATRDIMTALLEVAPTLKRAPRDRGAHATLTRVAEAALRANPASAEWQQVSTRVLALRDAAAAGEPATDLERRLREALAPVLALARRQTAGIGRGHAGAPGPLRSAWADEVRPR